MRYNAKANVHGIVERIDRSQQSPKPYQRGLRSTAKVAGVEERIKRLRALARRKLPLTLNEEEQ